MNHRLAFLGAAALVGAAGAIGVACSSPSAVDGDAGVLDGSTTNGGDAEADSPAIDAALRDAGGGATDSGKCSPVTGECDLVLQDCTTGKECTVVLGANGKPTASCTNAGTGNRPLGSTCCPGAQNQCVAGLECIGPACIDGGTPTARCTAHCCSGDDSVCGQSLPEGFRGSCDLTIVLDDDAGGTPLFDVCTYKGVCKPFHVQSCPAGYECNLRGVSFRCDEIFMAPGKPQDAPCSFGNECADGLACLGPSDAGPDASKCTTLCYHPDASAPPFDAGALSDAAGYGGCPATKGCGGTLIGAPDWLGFCTP